MSSNMQKQLVLEVNRYKLSSNLWLGKISRHVIVSLEGKYSKNRSIFSSEYRLHEGINLALPWSSKLESLLIHFYYIDERIKVDMGYSSFTIPTDIGFNTEGESNRLILDIFPFGGEEKIGRCLANIYIQELYAPEETQSTKRPSKGRSKDSGKVASGAFSTTLPNFRFRRLAKAINWHKIRGLNIDRLMESNDVKSLLSYIDDVALGDAAEEDCDERLLTAVQLSQFSVQYLLSTKKVLDEKKAIISNAIDTFQDEEDLLDLKIAKLRARRKAFRKEMEEMDNIADMYKDTLRRIGYEKPKRDSKHRSTSNSYRNYKREENDDYEESDDSDGRDRDRDRDRDGRSSKKEFGGSLHKLKSSSLASHHVRDNNSSGEEESDVNTYQSELVPPIEEIYDKAKTAKKYDSNNNGAWKTAKVISDTPPESNELDASSNDLLSLRRKAADSSPTRLRPFAADNNEKNATTPTQSKSHNESGSSLYTSPHSRSEFANIEGIKSVLVRSGSRESYMGDNVRDVSPGLGRGNDLENSQTRLLRSSQGTFQSTISVDSLANSDNEAKDEILAANERNDMKESSVEIEEKPIATARGGAAATATAAVAVAVTPSHRVATSRHEISSSKLKTRDSGHSLELEALEDSSMRTEATEDSLFISRPSEPSTSYADAKPEPLTPQPYGRFDYKDSKLSEAKQSYKMYGSSEKAQLSIVVAATENKLQDFDDDDDEDDPFGLERSVFTPSQSRIYSDSFVSTGDIDTSRSVTVELSTDILPGATATQSQSQSLSQKTKISPVRENSFEDEYSNSSSQLGPSNLEGSNLSSPREFSDNSSPNLIKFGNTRRGSNDEDAVLLGTNRFGTTYSEPLTGDSLRSRYSGTETMERDSLGGTIERNTDDTSNRVERFSPFTGDVSNDGSIPNVSDAASNDSIIGDKIKSSPSQSPVVQEKQDSHAPDVSRLTWALGKASIDRLELAEAFEVHISGIRLESAFRSTFPEVSVEFEFLDLKSARSHSIALQSDDIVQAVGYAAHMTFDEQNGKLLRDEIRELQDTVSIQINVLDAQTGEAVGQAIAEIWTMIEHTCNILRQEIEVFAYDMSAVIGSAVVDIKGHRLFSKFATDV